MSGNCSVSSLCEGNTLQGIEVGLMMLQNKNTGNQIYHEYINSCHYTILKPKELQCAELWEYNQLRRGGIDHNVQKNSLL